MSEDQAQPQEQQENGITVNVDPITKLNIQVQEFDKNIAVIEAQLYDLKKQKAEFIYNSNIQLIIDQNKQNLEKASAEQQIAKADAG